MDVTAGALDEILCVDHNPLNKFIKTRVVAGHSFRQVQQQLCMHRIGYELLSLKPWFHVKIPEPPLSVDRPIFFRRGSIIR